MSTVTPTPASEATQIRWLSIIGIGEDGVEGLSATARALVSQAELVVGGSRHLELAAPLVRGERLAWPSPLHEAFPTILERRGRPVAVLATGDPFHYGVGGQLAALVGPDAWRCIPQPSAFALSAARLGWDLQNVALVTLHGRALMRIARHLQPGGRILALSWDSTTPSRLAGLLRERGLGQSNLTVLERLGGPREHVRRQTAAAFAMTEIDPLNTVAVEVVAEPGAPGTSLAPGRDDGVFENDGQLTKSPVRAVTLASLAPRRGELLWDVGLGSGAVAIEWLLCDPTLRAIGIEARPDRAERARRNAANMGVPELEIVAGRAPASLLDLPAPDAVFVGGGLAEPGVMEAVWTALKPGGRLVANAVTLETEALMLAAHARHGGDLMRLEIARAEPVGPRRGWRPAMPVLHWRVVKP